MFGQKYKVIRDKTSYEASFNGYTKELIIGTADLDTNPEYVWKLIVHEIMEMCIAQTRCRYVGTSVEEDFMFVMDHKQFDVATALFSDIISKFIK